MAKLTEKELTKWVEAIVDGEEITEESAKELDEIGSKKVTLEEATVIARIINEATTKELLTIFNSVWNSIDLLQILLKDELGITDEQAKKASEKVKKKQQEYLEKKQQELKDKQKEDSESSEKVVELKLKND